MFERYVQQNMLLIQDMQDILDCIIAWQIASWIQDDYMADPEVDASA